MVGLSERVMYVMKLRASITRGIKRDKRINRPIFHTAYLPPKRTIRNTKDDQKRGDAMIICCEVKNTCCKFPPI